MTTLTNLEHMLLDYDCETSDINKIASFIKGRGVGIYSIAHEYNIYSIMQEEYSSLQELRDGLNAEANDGYDEEDQFDIFEDFNDKPVEGFLFGETFFSVHITEI